jgi:hypothetical protein
MAIHAPVRATELRPYPPSAKTSHGASPVRRTRSNLHSYCGYAYPVIGLTLYVAIAICATAVGVVGNLVATKITDRDFSWRFLFLIIFIGTVIGAGLSVYEDDLSATDDNHETETAPSAPSTTVDAVGPLSPGPPSPTFTSLESPSSESPISTLSDPTSSSTEGARPSTFKEKTFTIIDNGCYDTFGLDFDVPLVNSSPKPGYAREFEFSTCRSELAMISIKGGAEAMAKVEKEAPTYDDCAVALSSNPLEEFHPRKGDQFCVKTTSDGKYQSPAGRLIGYARVVGLTNSPGGESKGGSITLKASAWLLDE